MHADIADTEALAIFVYDSKKINAQRVHWRALLPADDGERSLFRIFGLSKTEIADIGRSDAANNRQNQTLHGWGEVKAKIVRDYSPPLVLRSDEPPPRHGVIEGWPADIEEKNKLAIALASKAIPVLSP